MSALPDTHRSALAWLAQRGGEGVVDRYGRIVAQGQLYGGNGASSVWLRLFCAGYLRPAGEARLGLSQEGIAQVEASRLTNCDDRATFPHDRRHGPMMTDDDPEDFA